MCSTSVSDAFRVLRTDRSVRRAMTGTTTSLYFEMKGSSVHIVWMCGWFMGRAISS